MLHSAGLYPQNGTTIKSAILLQWILDNKNGKNEGFPVIIYYAATAK
jgi:hypothetical protein